MATSGSDNFVSTRNELIEDALRNIGQLAEGEVATAQQITDGSRALERMIKSWQAAGLHLWKYEEMVLFLVENQSAYDLGTSTSDNWLKKSELVTTALAADGAISDTAMTVDSITGIANGDYIGVVTDDNTIHWTTVNGTPSGSTVTLTTGLDVAATTDNKVYAYTNKGVRPLQVTHGRVQIDTTSETGVTMISREDYFNLANKTATGTVIQAHYNPTLTAGKLYIYPETSDERQYLNLTAQISIEDFDAAGNNPDFPAEWEEPLVWGLSKRFLTQYGVKDPITVQVVLSMAEETYRIAEEFDVEETGIVFAPDFG